MIRLKHAFLIIFSMAVFATIFPANSFAASTTWNTKSVTAKAIPPTPKYVNTDQINALRLSCPLNEKQSIRSYASVLHTTGNLNHDYDIAITTGHGLIDANGVQNKNCTVSFPGGEPLPIIKARWAKNYKSGSVSDWAVLVIPKIKNEHLVRYQLGKTPRGNTLESIAEVRPKVLFSTARGLPMNGQICTMEPRRFAGLRLAKHKGMLAHTCRAIGGQSGAPISILQDNTPILLGIHVGNSMIYGYPTPSTPLHYRGYMRTMDAALQTQLQALVNTAQIGLVNPQTKQISTKID